MVYNNKRDTEWWLEGEVKSQTLLLGRRQATKLQTGPFIFSRVGWVRYNNLLPVTTQEGGAILYKGSVSYSVVGMHIGGKWEDLSSKRWGDSKDIYTAGLVRTLHRTASWFRVRVP